jgi:hypothetical protein
MLPEPAGDSKKWTWIDLLFIANGVDCSRWAHVQRDEPLIWAKIKECYRHVRGN